jgi:hypothetical protein
MKETDRSDPVEGQQRKAENWDLLAPVCPHVCPHGCENFLYGFKAARRGRSRRRLGAQAVALADAPLRPGQRRSAGAKDKTRAARHVVSFACAQAKTLTMKDREDIPYLAKELTIRT